MHTYTPAGSLLFETRPHPPLKLLFIYSPWRCTHCSYGTGCSVGILRDTGYLEPLLPIQLESPIRCRDRWFKHNLDIIDYEYYSTALSYQFNRKPTWSTCGCAAEWKAIAFRNRIIIVPRSLMILYSTTRVLEILERYPWTCLLSQTTRYSSTSSCLVSGHNLDRRPSAFSFNLLLA
jgi:hypothetical protein